MAKPGNGWLDRLSGYRTMRRWASAANNANDIELENLRQLRSKARGLRNEIDRFLFKADERLALPQIGSTRFRRPTGSDWAWRPAIWRGPLGKPGIAAVESRTKLGEETTLFHDCKTSELTLRQLRNKREADLAPYGLRMDVFRFDGSFLSLVIDLPSDAVNGLSKNHIVSMNCIVEMEKQLELFGRLNIKHGPNTEQIVREIPLDSSEAMAEFDLAYSNLNEKRIERAWIDIIFEGPEMNEVILRDVTFSRRPRANL